MTYTKPFKELGRNDAHLAGGKGASLGEMLQNNIPVPDGFVVLAETFEHFLEVTDLTQEIDSILHTIDHTAIHTVEHASGKIQNLIEAQEMPEAIREQIMQEFKKLGSRYVAVRSSATAEDGAEHAWAGQLESYLNTTEVTLLAHVQKCWASLFTPRAIFYRFEKGLHGTSISVAVVIQQMVESEISGIAFSVHPVTEDYNQLIIEAGLGLGEAIVSGAVTPDSYVVEKEPRRIVDTNVSEQGRALYRESDSGGNVWRDLGSDGGKQKLTEQQILELSEIILRIESHYGFPCDIEWAFEGGKFYIVQSRPITTLAQKTGTFTKNDLVEVFIEMNKGKKLYPALQSYSAFMLGSGFHLKKYCERWYGKGVSFDVLILMKKGFSQVWFPEEYMKLTSQIALQEYIKNKDKFQKRIDFFNQNLKKMDEFYSKYDSKKINELKSDKLLFILKELRDLTWSVNAPLICVNDIDKEMCWNVLEYEGFELTKKEFDNLWEKASEPAFESIDKIQLKEILSLIISKQAWSEIVERCQYYLTDYHSAKDLSVVGDSLKQQYSNFIDNPEDATRKLKSESSEIKKTIDSHEKWLNSLPKNQRTLAEYLHSVMLLRDRRKSFLNKGLTVVYRIAEKIFSSAGIEKDLIPYYTIDELLLGLEHLQNSKDTLEGRKNGFQLLIKYSGEIRMLNTQIEEAAKRVNSFFMNFENKEKDGDTIQGQTGSRGVMRGRVKIVFDVHSNHGFQDKEILVTGMTRPEFVPLMKKAAGIVTDEGGVTCHAAIVSRELKIPCIIGTKFATQVLKDGDLVEVDADNGVVRILERGDLNERILLTKSYERDFTLVLEQPWASGLTEDMAARFGFKNPYKPMIVLYATGENLQIWEHKKGLDYFLDWLLKKNQKGTAFIDQIISEYRSLLVKIEEYWERGAIKDKQALREYAKTLRKAVSFFSLWYYSGVDDRTPETVKKLVLSLREKDNFFAGNDEFIKKCLESLGVKRALSNLALSDEFPDIPSNEVLEKRASGVVVIDGKEVSFSSLQQFANTHKKFAFEGLFVKSSQVREISGQTAYSGKLQGMVSIVKNMRQMAKVQEGDILVSPMTTPDFVPAMQKAAAFVTDEGGIMCHAAIVAREMKKPCIIGTKIATQVLKDGDLVEVDADNGVVRIIEKV